MDLKNYMHRINFSFTNFGVLDKMNIKSKTICSIQKLNQGEKEWDSLQEL